MSQQKVINSFKLILFVLITLSSLDLKAGYFEIFTNGSYYKHNNGLIGGDPSTTKTLDIGGGLAYRFLSNTSVEFAYRNSTTKDWYTQDYTELDEKYRVNKETVFENYSLSLVLDFADRKASFRPYIKGGGGYTIRQTKFSGTAIDKITDESRPLSFENSPKTESISAVAGVGLKIFVIESIALEASYTVYATDLDKDKTYLHYSIAGGLRYVF